MDQIKDSVGAAGNVLKNPCIPLLPDPPMYQDSNGVEIAPVLLGDSFSCRQPPLLRGTASVIRNGEVLSRPLPEDAP